MPNTKGASPRLQGVVETPGVATIASREGVGVDSAISKLSPPSILRSLPRLRAKATAIGGTIVAVALGGVVEASKDIIISTVARSQEIQVVTITITIRRSSMMSTAGNQPSIRSRPMGVLVGELKGTGDIQTAVVDTRTTRTHNSTTAEAK